MSTPLAAQEVTPQARNAWAFGFAGTLGNGWQLEAGDIGYLRFIHLGPFRSTTLGVRLGSFIDEGAIVGGARGFLGAGIVGLRTGLLPLADVGNETNPAPLGLDLSIEGAYYGGSNSPLPQGASWGAVGLYPGVRFGTGDSPRYSLVVGPTIFIGPVTSVHGFFGLRFELPVAHRGGR